MSSIRQREVAAPDRQSPREPSGKPRRGPVTEIALLVVPAINDNAPAKVVLAGSVVVDQGLADGLHEVVAVAAATPSPSWWQSRQGRRGSECSPWDRCRPAKESPTRKVPGFYGEM